MVRARAEPVTLEDVEQVLSRVDQNNDGKISYDEFTAVILEEKASNGLMTRDDGVRLVDRFNLDSIVVDQKKNRSPSPESSDAPRKHGRGGRNKR